jgi:hypothetical protein
MAGTRHPAAVLLPWTCDRSPLAVGLRPSTRAKYRYLLDKHIIPALGDVDMVALQPTDVRSWWARLAAEIPSTAAGAYRLLAVICNTAVADQVILRSPCRVKGGGSEKSSERPTATRHRRARP